MSVALPNRVICTGTFTSVTAPSEGQTCSICLEPALETEQLTHSKDSHSDIFHVKCFRPEGLPALSRCPICRINITSVNGTPVQQAQPLDEVIHNVAFDQVLASSNEPIPMSKKMKALYIFLTTAIICAIMLCKVITVVPLIVLILMFIALLFWHLTADCRRDRELAMDEHRLPLRQPILREVE